MTAEFAIVLPAVLLVLVAVLGAMQLAGEQLRLQAATADAARSFARGDRAAATRVIGTVAGATVSTRTRGEMVCADARVSATIGGLPSVTLRATSCALNEPTA